MGVRISWNRERDGTVKPKFANQLGKIVELVQENLMSILVTGNAEANVTTCWSSGIGESFVHGV